eukprot:maker-scaffold_14-snap-gene-10.23-mRNA-1 protein AED:0.02 eAED:0.26 QI:83/0.8/0.83/1/0.8/0.66/6/0/251
MDSTVSKANMVPLEEYLHIYSNGITSDTCSKLFLPQCSPTTKQMLHQSLSRCLTVFQFLEANENFLDSQSSMLNLLILGADVVESRDPRKIFLPLFELLTLKAFTKICIYLIGPNLAADPTISLKPLKFAHKKMDIEITLFSKLFHKIDDDSLNFSNCLAVAFQPALWGYDSWKPSLQRVLSLRVCTAYNLQEADSDYEVMTDIIEVCENISITMPAPFKNRFASLLSRPSGIENRDCIENDYCLDIAFKI